MKPLVRIANESDMRFVHSNFHQGYWQRHARDRIEKEVYYPEMDARIDRLCGTSRVAVAYFEEVPDEILGYCISGYNALHWVYVKSVYRRQGIASGLVPDGLLYYTHKTDSVGQRFLDSLHLKYNPFRLETT